MKTGIPYIVDQNLFNTLDFLIAAGNLNSIVKQFPNEICLAYLYNFTKSTNDPIMAQAKFFEQINKNLLKLKNNSKCSKNKYVSQYNFIKANLELTENEILFVDGSGSNLTRINSQTNKLEILVVNTSNSNDTRWVEFLENITTEVDSILNTVNDDYGESSMSEEFCLYWIDIFNRSMQQVKDEYYKLDPAYEKGIFQELSDSIRLYTRYKENFDVVNGPLRDPYYEFNDMVPRHFPSTIGDKIDDQTQLLMIEFSEKTSYLHRKNLKNLYTDIAVKFISEFPHGVDLITDDKYYEHIGAVNDALIGSVANYLDLGSKIVEFKILVGNSSDNKQEITKALIDKIIQDTTCDVDFWQQLFQDIKNPITTKLVLDSDEHATGQDSIL